MREFEEKVLFVQTEMRKYEKIFINCFVREPTRKDKQEAISIGNYVFVSNYWS